MPDTLLVVDDEPAIRHAIVRAFADLTVIEADSLAAALVAVKDKYPDLVLLDNQLPDGQGLDLLAKIRAVDADLPVVLLTGSGSTDLAVDALKQGAVDYIEKPFKIERLRTTVGHLLQKQQLGRQVAKLAGKGGGRTSIVAHAPGTKRVLALVKRVAAVPSTTVLIQGESGVGKELIAKAIHERSARCDNQFVAINCAALSENLLEAELFGYEKGSFTGADSKGKAGLFELANGGTIFLDEVGEMPIHLQTKLLRVLQERRFRRVGGLADIEVDVRVVAATNRDLRAEVVAGRFRQDLYFRLRVVPVPVPPLRERREDILPIADHLLKRLTVELNRPGLVFSDSARRAMLDYAWPGNVRELCNAVERAVISAEGGEIGLDDLVLDEVLFQPAPQPSATTAPAAAAPITPPAPAAPALPPGSIVLAPGERNLARIEALIVKAALADAGGQKSKAAELLGINRTTLYNKLKEIDPGAVEVAG